MFKHATISRTSKAHQAFTQSQLSQLQQQVQAAAADRQVSNNLDQIDAMPPLTTTLTSSNNMDWFSSARFISSSCSASPTPSTQTPNTSSSFVSSAPSSVFSSPSKQHINNSKQQNGSHLATVTTLSNKSAHSMIKIFAQTLSQDVEYVTLQVNAQTKSKQIIRSLLRKFRLKHRDPNLFYLTLERWIRKDGLRVKSVMLLNDEACPLQLQQCCSNPPHDDIKFTMQARTGALMKIYCFDVCPNTRYKCLSLSPQTTVDETIELMLHCLNLHTSNTGSAQVSSVRGGNNNFDRQTQTDQQHPRLANSPGGNSSHSSSSSQSSSSSSSGIESDPTNQLLSITSTLKLNLNSRASSVTSISSSSNISNNSTSLTINDNSNSSCNADLYCLVIECKGTSHRRVLGSDEYLVDVYQNLIDEARQESATLSADATSPNSESKASLFVRSLSNGSSIVSSTALKESSELMKQQQPEQWFVIKLKRRDSISPHHLDLIKTTNPHKQLMPLPPIPQSLSLQAHNANELKHVVSTTQIEVNNRPGSSLAATTSLVGSSHSSGSLMRGKYNNGFSFDATDRDGSQQPIASTEQNCQATATTAAPVSVACRATTQPVSLTTFDGIVGGAATKPVPLVSDDSQLHYGNVQQIRQHYRQMSANCASDAQRMPPPPASLIWLPAVKPRRRNLSSASSTFQRRPAPPHTRTSSSGLKITNSSTCNRRRYDPMQLAKDLNELDLGNSPSTTTNDTQSMVVQPLEPNVDH